MVPKICSHVVYRRSCTSARLLQRQRRTRSLESKQPFDYWTACFLRREEERFQISTKKSSSPPRCCRPSIRNGIRLVKKIKLAVVSPLTSPQCGQILVRLHLSFSFLNVAARCSTCALGWANIVGSGVTNRTKHHQQNQLEAHDYDTSMGNVCGSINHHKHTVGASFVYQNDNIKTSAATWRNIAAASAVPAQYQTPQQHHRQLQKQSGR